MRGLLSAVNNNTPLAGLRRALANSMNPYMREFSNEYERTFMAAIPGYALTRPIQTDVLTGKPLMNPVGGLWNANVPFETSRENKDPVARFLMDVEFAWKDTLEKAPNGQPLLAEQKAFIREAMFKNGLRKELDDFRKLQWVKDDLENWKSRSLGKMSDVGAFTEKSEVTITHRSSGDIKQVLQEKISRLLGPDVQDVTPKLAQELGIEVIEEAVDEVDIELDALAREREESRTQSLKVAAEKAKEREDDVR
jgi:hypothetical protein